MEKFFKNYLIILLIIFSCKEEKKEKVGVLTHGGKAIEGGVEKPIIVEVKEKIPEEIAILSFFSEWDTYIVIKKGTSKDLSLKMLKGLYFFTEKEDFLVFQKKSVDIKEGPSIEVIELREINDDKNTIIFPEKLDFAFWNELKDEPDFKDFYHNEKIFLIGVGEIQKLPFLSFVHKEEGFTGGAHPYSYSQLKTISISEKKVVSLKENYFKNRNIEKEIKKNEHVDECVSNFDNVAPVEERGEKTKLIASFNNSYEVCRGDIHFYPIYYEDEKKTTEKKVFKFDKNTLFYKESVIAKNIYDYRISPSGNEVLFLKMLGIDDEFHPLWNDGRKDKKRELIYWESETSSIILGRVNEINYVQWLKGNPRNKEIFKLVVKD